MKMFVEDDVDPKALADARIAVIGYGSQGRAHALNLRDSGYKVVVGLRPDGKTAARAKADGFDVRTPAEAAKGATLVAMLTPDMSHRALFEQIEKNLSTKATLLFAHGFSIHYHRVQAAETLDVVLVAPKGPGDLVRRQYEAGQGVPCLIAVANDATGRAQARALAYAHAIGGTRSGVLETTFAEETETDLFGEQAVLCGGATELVLKGYETLVEAGYQPEVAYFECLHELKLIVDLIYQGGLNYMRYSVSDTAEHGDYTGGPRVVTEQTRQELRKMLAEVQDGTYAKAWMAEHAAGRPWFDATRKAERSHQIEQVGAKLRDMMPFLDPVKDPLKKTEKEGVGA